MNTSVAIHMGTEDGMIYKRPGSRYWYARFHVRGRRYERSTGALTPAGALEGLRLYRLQVERRGDPLRADRTGCFADYA